MRDVKSLLLVLLSIGLVGTWAYHLYDKTHYSQLYSPSRGGDSAVIAEAIRDSLNRYYSSTINELDFKLASSRNSADSLQNRLAVRLREISQLRSEILTILNRQNLSQTELAVANEKMVTLQQKVGELKEENNVLEQEKQEFGMAIQQLSRNTDSLQRQIAQLSGDNETLQRRMSTALVFMASELKLAAMNIRSSGEVETFQVKKADKFVVSFVVQNNVSDQPNSEVVVVITQPDGEVLQNSKWESGTFASSQGKKNYTRLVKFDYEKGDRREMSFSLDVEQFQKGNYKLQLWHRGALVGSAVTGLY